MLKILWQSNLDHKQKNCRAPFLVTRQIYPWTLTGLYLIYVGSEKQLSLRRSEKNTPPVLSPLTRSWNLKPTEAFSVSEFVGGGQERLSWIPTKPSLQLILWRGEFGNDRSLNLLSQDLVGARWVKSEKHPVKLT